MPRLHLEAPLAIGAELELPPPLAHKLGAVLRLPSGAELVLFNGDGLEHRGRLRWSGRRAVVRLESTEDARARESPLAITLLQSLLRGEKMDFVVQKATELGVARIRPLIAGRGAVRLEGERLARRLAHWRAVAVAACEQCGRARIPSVDAPLPVAELASTPLPDARWVLDPEGSRGGGPAPPAAALAIAVGPEGGFCAAELESLERMGFRRWSLGPRILRTETAGPAAIAVLQSCWGDLGRPG